MGFPGNPDARAVKFYCILRQKLYIRIKQKHQNQDIIVNINGLYNNARKGDRGAEERLFSKLYESFNLFVQQRIWNRQDCEEIVQDTLMAIKDKYGNMHFETSFAAWAYKVLENKILYFLRSKRYHENKYLRDSDFKQPRQFYSDPTFKSRLLDCLKKVSAKNMRQARILNMHYQGFSVDEICEKLRLTRNGMYIHLSRARSLLKLCLEKGDLG